MSTQASSSSSSDSPVCAGCKSFITDNRAVRVGTKYFHVDHFTCTSCHKPLANEEYVEDESGSKRMCEACFNKEKIPKVCSKCNERIFGEAITGMSASYHPKCFTCTKCTKPLLDSRYGVVGGKVVCGACKAAVDKRVCDLCNRLIEGDAKFAVDKWYHPEHFVCCVCREVLDAFNEEDGKIYCKQHFAEKTAKTCQKCSKPIFRRELYEVEGKTYHMACFKCVKCSAALSLKYYKTWAGQPFCPKCATEEGI